MKLKSRFYGILLGCALLLCGAPLHAQWSGSADLATGLGGMEGNLVNEEQPMLHGLLDGTFQLNYKRNKFSWGTTVKGKWEPKTTDNARISYKNELLNITYKAAETRPLTASIKSDFTWTPTPLRNYNAWILYQYKNDGAYNHSLNFDGTEEQMKNLSYYYEVPSMNENKVETGIKTYRDFGSGNHILQSTLVFEAVNNRKVNTWTVFKTDPKADSGGTAIDYEDVKGYAWNYRITPTSTDFKLKGDIRLRNALADESVRINFTPGMRFEITNALDQNSGATRVDIDVTDESKGEWRDSTRLRENFDFLSIQGESYILADVHWRQFEAHADYALQVYGRRLNNDEFRQPLKVKGLYPVGKSHVRWNISPHHALTLKNEMSVKHPDYLKVCWYDRTAGYLDQLYRGNEQLISPQTMLCALEYTFKWKGFESKTSVSYKDVINEIDQTWSNEEIDGRQYKVFRWLNSSDGRSLGLSQSLGWTGRIITAHAAINYNQSHRMKKDSDAVKNSFDWKLTGDVAARLGKGWTVGMDAKYQSKVATFFTIFKEYCELNAFVQKEFKRVTVYLKGKDLLDNPRETSFESEELKEAWIEQVRSNRRLFVIGVRWKF